MADTRLVKLLAFMLTLVLTQPAYSVDAGENIPETEIYTSAAFQKSNTAVLDTINIPQTSITEEPESIQQPSTSKPSPTTSKPSPTTSKPSPTTTKPSPTTSKPSPTTSKPSPTTTKPSPTTTKPSPTTTKPSPTTKPIIQTTLKTVAALKTILTSKATPKTSSTPRIPYPVRTRTCKCELWVEEEEEPEIKINLSYVTYQYFRGFVRDSNCYDHHKCGLLCRQYGDANLKRGIDSLRTKYATETAGDYACGKINKPVLSNRPVRVSLVASIRGCPGSYSVRTLDNRMCCTGHTHSYKRVDCTEASSNVIG